MRWMLANQVARSPWMNPARWAGATPTPLPPESAGGHIARDHYTARLVEGAAVPAAAERVRAALLAYRLFPRERLIAAMPEMTVTPGATIVQGLRLGPLGLIMAVRVLTVFDRTEAGQRRTGFSYVTLAGHLERGAMTFAVIEDMANQTLQAEIDVVSQPDHWLTRLGGPLARRVQRASTQAVVVRLAEVALGMERAD